MLRVIKLSEKAKTPELVNGAMDLFSTKITTEVGEDAKLVIVYHTDLSVDVPEGYVGIITPRSDIYKKSIMQTDSVTAIWPGNNEELTVRFKTNTDVVPSVYKEGDAFAKMYFLVAWNPSQLDVEEFTSTVEEKTESTAIADEAANEAA